MQAFTQSDVDAVRVIERRAVPDRVAAAVLSADLPWSGTPNPDIDIGKLRPDGREYGALGGFWSELKDVDDAREVLRDLVGADADADEFWRSVEGNLNDGGMRLTFVADRVPTELQSSLEFLNERTDPTEVIAVEPRQFAGPGELRVLVPRVIGVTAAARRAKRSGPGYDELLDGAPAEGGRWRR